MPLTDQETLTATLSGLAGYSGLMGTVGLTSTPPLPQVDQGIPRDVLRDIISLEVNRQMKAELAPIHAGIKLLEEGVDKIKEWKLKLWSNGSGGPPGWLEVFAKDMNNKVDSVTSLVKEVKTLQIIREAERDQHDRDNTKRLSKWTFRIGVGMFIISALTIASSLIEHLHLFK